MKIKWMAVAISLVCVISLAAATAWAGPNNRGRGKRVVHLEKAHTVKGGCDSSYRSHRHYKHQRHGLKSPYKYKRHHHHHRAVGRHYHSYHRPRWHPRQSRVVFGISIYDPRWGFGYYTERRR